MSIMALLLAASVVAAVRTEIRRSRYFHELGKDLPPMPLGR
jgi:hypothetical protein